MNKKLLYVSIFVCLLGLAIFWPTTAYSQQETIPPDTTIYLPSIYGQIISHIDPIEAALTPEDAPWHKTIFSSTASPPDYKYAVTVYENLTISQTQNFQLSSEVFVIPTVEDARSGYESLQLNEGVTQTLPLFDDEALLTTITKTGIIKEILKFRRANVVAVITCQGLVGVYQNDMIMDAAILVRNRIH